MVVREQRYGPSIAPNSLTAQVCPMSLLSHSVRPRFMSNSLPDDSILGSVGSVDVSSVLQRAGRYRLVQARYMDTEMSVPVSLRLGVGHEHVRAVVRLWLLREEQSEIRRRNRDGLCPSVADSLFRSERRGPKTTVGCINACRITVRLPVRPDLS